MGDYYYADGNIVPKDFPIVPAGCIGVVFSTTTNHEMALDGVTACNHGYVLSLKMLLVMFLAIRVHGLLIMDNYTF